MDLGSILIRLCLVDRDDVAKALERQAEETPKRPIGKMLVEAGKLESDQLLAALALQVRLKSKSRKESMEATSQLLERARSELMARMKRANSK